jgi:hypothetical protein
MSATIQPTGWPNNMSADDRKVWIQDQIVRWVGEKKIDECLSALELGNLSMTEKMVAYRSVLIMGGVRHCRNNPRAEARIPILTLIVYLSDNAKGTCHLSISEMQKMLMRSRQCIVDNILALEMDGSIGIARINGMPNSYWPRIPAALAEMSPNPLWFVEAVTGAKRKVYRTVEEAIAAATTGQSSTVDRSNRVDRHQSRELDQHRSSAVDPTSQVQQANRSSPAGEPVKSSTDSISSLNLFSSSPGMSGERADTTKKSDPAASIDGKSAIAAALGGQAAYATRNIVIANSGKISIGEEFRAELREIYTDSQIERGIERAPSQAGGSTDPVKLIAQIRRCCSYAKQDDEKQFLAAGNGRSTQRTYAR